MSAPAAAAVPASAGGKPSTTTMSVKLKRKRATTDFDGPVLARFPHGPPAQLCRPADEEDDEDKGIECKMYAHSDERKASQRILLVETPGVQYVAQNYGAQHSYKANQNQYAIGVFDAAKQKVKIVSVNHVYKLDQNVRALDAMDVDEPTSTSTDTFQTKQRVLADTFGSKKTQKRLASRAANEVTVQESTSQVLTHAVGSIQPNNMEAEESLLETIHERVLPKYDEQAQSVREIYTTEALMPQPVADALGAQYKAWRSVLKKGKSGVAKNLTSQEPLSKSAFVANRMNALAALEGSAERDPEQVKLLIYFDLLLRFRNGGKNKKKLVSEWTEEQAPERVKDQAMADFTVSAPTADGVPRSVFDGHCEQKLLCHLAVMSVRLSNFHMEASQIEAMATDLKMMTTDMLKYYLEAGCTASKMSIKLTAPLKLPKLRKKMERK
jgi:hypothetical protein